MDTSRTDMPDRMRDLVLAVDAYRRAFADVLGLGVGEVLTLADLGRQGPVPVSLLAARLGMSAPAGTALVDRMQTRGLAVRRPHPSDRRSTLVDLTPRGRRAAAILGRLFREDVHAALQDVPVEHLRRRLLREDTAEPGVPDPDEGAPA